MSVDQITLYRSVASSSFTPLWMLEELGVAYRTEMTDIRSGAQKAPDYLKLNPMGKVPTLTVNEVVVTEAAAICLFLADRYAYGTLAPKTDSLERGPYLRWSFFAAAVAVPAMTLNARGINAPAWQVAWGAYDDMVRTLVGLLRERDFVAGAHFTTADVILGAAVGFGLFNKLLPDDPVLVTRTTPALRPGRPSRRPPRSPWPPDLTAQPTEG